MSFYNVFIDEFLKKENAAQARRHLGISPTPTPAPGGGNVTPDQEMALAGAAGGVLSGDYPNPGFAVSMATQAQITRAGVVTLVAGTATVINSSVTAKTVVLAVFKTLNGTSAGILTWTSVVGTSFTITSVGATGAIVETDVSAVCYFLVEIP